MDGVMILNTIPFVATLAGLRDFLLLLIDISLIGVVLFVGRMIERYGGELRYLIATVIIGLVVLCLLYGAKGFVKDMQRGTYYEVTVSNNVKFNDFNDKYEIIEQRGDIFIVMERKQPQETAE